MLKWAGGLAVLNSGRFDRAFLKELRVGFSRIVRSNRFQSFMVAGIKLREKLVVRHM